MVIGKKGQGAGNMAILDGLVRARLIEEMRLESRLEGSKGVSHLDVWQKSPRQRGQPVQSP